MRGGDVIIAFSKKEGGFLEELESASASTGEQQAEE
jgi:hypothetical protein